MCYEGECNVGGSYPRKLLDEIGWKDSLQLLQDVADWEVEPAQDLKHNIHHQLTFVKDLTLSLYYEDMRDLLTKLRTPDLNKPTCISNLSVIEQDVKEV